MQSTMSKLLKIEEVKSLKIGLPKKIGQLRFKYKDKCAAFNLKWKGIPEVRRAHEKALKPINSSLCVGWSSRSLSVDLRACLGT